MTDVDALKSVLDRTANEVFLLCAQTAEDLATKVESDELPVDAMTALRLLATIFRSSGERRYAP